MSFKKELKNIQINAEKKLGFPLTERFWGLVEEDLGNTANDFDGDPEGQEVFIEGFRDITERYVTVLRTQPSIKAKTEIETNPELVNSKKIYRKPFERRLHLLEFVLGEKGGSKKRVNWQQLTTLWNNKHPHDQKTQGVLKVEYYRARKDKFVINNLVVLKTIPQIKVILTKFIALWEHHPEIKNLNELNELDDAPDEGYILNRGNVSLTVIFKLGKYSNVSWLKATLNRNPDTGKLNIKIGKTIAIQSNLKTVIPR